MKKKRQLNLPAGHHDANSASELLDVSKIKLLKTLREVGFLMIDKRNGLRSATHNLPHPDIKARGWAYHYTCTYGSGANKQIDHSYDIVVFTPEGFQEVKKIMTDPSHYKLPITRQAEPRATPPPSDCAGEARKTKKAKSDYKGRLDLLSDLGIELDKAS